ncbi:MAG: tRNA lysidine(34) synthetase TilS [Acidobacteriota bacterium]|nr:tRNA lysidine(34) synthetase TilS [Acidobacteriota bacterium]
MIVERIRGAVAESGLIAPGERVVAMLSGGRDSVCLLDVLVSRCGGEMVRALHVNYGLRGAGSEGDERHCSELCERLGVSLEVRRCEGRGGGAGNLQAWAREARYGAAEALAERLESAAAPGHGDAGARVRVPVASGHTATDQVETILYRLSASPGRRALLGMPARSGRVVRPLLAVTREETAAYCAARGLGWREDESNGSARFARARVRGGLAPALAAVHPAAEANVLRTAALLREETELLEGLVDAELGDGCEIAVERLRSLPTALRRLVVVRMAELASGRYVPQAGERVAEILELADRARPGPEGRMELHVGGMAGAVVEGGVLRMVKLAPRGSGSP